jgi:hypothetical protein
VRSILPLHPEFDRPSVIDVSITIHPKKEIKFLLIKKCLEVP